MKQYISYLRLSKERSDQRYYGIESQREIIENKVDGPIIEEYVEIVSGTRAKRHKRKELQKALAHCRKTGATLIVAKLDRLYRCTESLMSVVNSGVDITFCDFDVPKGITGRIMITIVSAMAEYEAKRISERTREGLRIAKKNGKKLGNPHLPSRKAGIASGKARKNNTERSANIKLKGRIMLLQGKGRTASQIAEILNEEGEHTTTGKRFTKENVYKIVA